MSYIAKVPQGYEPTGITASEVWDKAKSLLSGTSAGEIIGKAESAVTAGKAILDDPYFPEVTSLILRLKAIEAKKGGSSSSGGKGVGLGSVVKPLRLFVAYKENPWVGGAIVAGLFFLPFVAGYFVGKRK